MVHSVLKSQQIGQHITTEGKPVQPNGGTQYNIIQSFLFCLKYVVSAGIQGMISDCVYLCLFCACIQCLSMGLLNSSC